jgi:cation-transporting ATPase 13A1
LKSLPDNYDDIYLHYAREGSRVLCLGYKELGVLSHQQVRKLFVSGTADTFCFQNFSFRFKLRDKNRDEIERDLEFGGFLIISCPLKPDSKSIIKEILHSSHHVTMITGDNPLTACHVAGELKFIKKQNAVLLQTDETSNSKSWYWTTIDNKKRFDLENYEADHDLCLTGDAFEHLYKTQQKLLRRIIARVKVFARVSPKQKENVVTLLKDLGYYTLMCGDGTNDVGALKHADVGVALLSHSDFVEKKRLNIANNPTMAITQPDQLANETSLRNRNPNANPIPQQSPQERAQQRAHNAQVLDFSIYRSIGIDFDGLTNVYRKHCK